MNIQEAKAIPLPEFLAQLGFQPAYVRGKDVWYTSPLRPNERTPSFKVNLQGNLWYDFGHGAG